MLDFIAVWMRSFFTDEEGASAIEYGLILGLIAIILIVALGQIGTGLNTLFQSAATSIGSAGSGS
ncbi:Flp family type IVb pilin [Algiphilus sp.]|uniref:Flp family type IVb pilin n=1 Tax=Algiphilus sp. TaxID=1872431 RepID=UPI0025B9C209|nr:Flp family type IVb pilin [Algiphilus sp.]MCI5061682.1 Flp family type IVb pilin [Algiphilus sp.]MCI5103721.1 Flp family type IVb pilin [Algiphilus sp.]MCR9089920.1 Flp family type IVb pilin [Pseudomonadota bacterium]